MTNLTFTDIKETNINSEKHYSTKMDYSSVEKSGFLKIFENANKNTNSTYEQLQNSGNNSFGTDNSVSTASAFNQESTYGVNNQYTGSSYDSNIKTASMDQNKCITENKSIRNSDTLKAGEKKQDQQVSYKKEEKTKNTENEIKSKKDLKTSNNEVKSDESKDQLKSRIQLAMVIDTNFIGNKIADINKNKANLNNVMTKDIKNQAQDKVSVNQKNSKNVTTNTDFQLVQNRYLSKAGNNKNNNLENTASDKNVKNSQNQQESKKIDNKAVDNTSKDNKKIEVLIQSDHPELGADNLKQGNVQLSSSTQKDLNDIFHKSGAAKPVITKLEIADSLNNSASGQKQKQNLMDGQTATLAAQQIQSANTAKVGTENAVAFDKVMDAKLNAKIDSDSVLNQISQKTSSEIQNGKTEIAMSLRPEGLGKVDISLTSDKGVVAAQIIAENSQVKDLLNNEIDSLKQKLQDQGVNIDSVTVKIQEPAKSNNDNNSFEQDLHKFNQPDQNASNSSDFNSNKQAQDKVEQKQTKYDASDLQTELDLKTGLNNSEVHQGLVDYRI